MEEAMSRLERLYQSLDEAGLAALALVPGPNLRYLTSLAMHQSERLTMAFLRRGQAALVLPALEVPRVREFLAVETELLPWTDDEGPEGALRRLRETMPLGGERIGVEERTMRLLEWYALQRAFPLCLAEPADPLVAGLRMLKDDAEIACMRQAAAALEKGLYVTLERLRPGMTERQVARAWQWATADLGVDSVGEEPIVVAGARGASPHNTPSDRPIAVGELITLDWVASVRGYYADITRTVALGEPGAEHRRIYELVLEANAAGRAAVKPGLPAEAVDQAARAVIAAGGYGPAFLHRTGHGLGLEVHEPPYIVQGNTQLLRPGMTFTVEPGVYVEGLGGVRIEDDIVVTETGGESLTTMMRELAVL
jgi:Xaa-Pro dipeptidase